jgi:starch synthase (maltosyl-transferring)
VARINQIRRDNPALAAYRDLSFYDTDSDSVIFYGKRSPDGANHIWVVVNLDPFETHEASLRLPMSELGLPADGRLQVHELITDQRHLWRGPTHAIRLDPRREPAAILRVAASPPKSFDDLGY